MVKKKKGKSEKNNELFLAGKDVFEIERDI